MKNKKKVFNSLLLGLFLLGGCALLENCDGYYELIGNLTIVAATQTHIAAFASKVAMDSIAAHSYGAPADNWYLNTDLGYLYVRVTKSGSYVDPDTLINLTGVEKFEVKIDTTGTDGSTVDLELAWTNVLSTPTADGNMSYTASDGNQVSATFTDITYSTSSWVNGGISAITFTPNVPLFGSFIVTLTHNADESAVGNVVSDPAGSDLGEVKIVPNKDAAKGEPIYEVEYVKNAAGETMGGSSPGE